MARSQNFEQMGFTPVQVKDLEFLLSLKNASCRDDWLECVDEEDVFYAISLLECAAYAIIDNDIDQMTQFPEADELIQMIMEQ